MKRTLRLLLPCLLSLPLLLSCREKEEVTEEPREENNPTYEALNFFAYNALDMYYLWIDEIQSSLETWYRYDDPVASVEKVRYKDSDGEDIDKWTQMIDDYESFTSSVAGVSTTFGLDYKLYYLDSSHQKIVAVVTFTYADSPARAAGLQRGDVISAVDGITMTPDNYISVVYDHLIGGSSVSLTLSSGKTVDMTAVTMYENPVLEYKFFNCGSKRVGYLAYTSFTLDSCEELIEACKYFKSREVTELVLDLRYNSGGYVYAEEVLASMLAPESAVRDSAVFEKEVYNANIRKSWGEDYGTSRFTTHYDFTSSRKSYKFSTADANIGLEKIYALVSGDTASAAESILVGLGPYLDIEIIGTQTYGKYCGGIMYGACEWYEDYRKYIPETDYENGIKYCTNWGIYLMISRYADCNGNTPCMPSGFVPDFEVSDNPVEAIPLGDPSEKMLSVALQHAGYVSTASTAVKPSSAAPAQEAAPVQPSGAPKGLRILHL